MHQPASNLRAINDYFTWVGWSARFRAVTGAIVITAIAALAFAAHV